MRQNEQNGVQGGDLHLAFSFLEAAVNDLSLRNFEAIHQRGNRSLDVCQREQDEFLVYEIRESEILFVVIQVRALFKMSQPFLAIGNTFLRERHVNDIICFTP